MITVDHTTEDAVIGQPLNVWRAAKAIDAMCVRQGRGGWATGLGHNVFGKSCRHLSIGGDSEKVWRRKWAHWWSTAVGDTLYLVIENGHRRAPFRPQVSDSPGSEITLRLKATVRSLL